MTVNFDQARVELGRTLFLRMADATGVAVVCLEGCLWLTRDGSPEDVLLSPGQVYRVKGATPVIVTAFEPSLARVLQPQAKCRLAELRQLASFLPRWGRRLVAV